MFSVHRCVINNFFARFIMDQLLDILNEINSDVDYDCLLYTSDAADEL